MYLRTLHLRAFRNYLDQAVKFEAQKTILLGNNAQGKTNLLEAVELLATLKSHRANRDSDLILQGHATAQILATVERAHGIAELALSLRAGGRRTLSLNQETVRRHLDFLGTLNTVQFSSLDLDLVRGSPDSRRNWLDALLIQLEPIYAHILHQYQQILRQRNALLKAMRQQEETADTTQLSLWDAQLAEAGSRVTRRRARVLERLAPLAQVWHASISGRAEHLEIRYLPNVNWTEDAPARVQEAFLQKLAQRRLAERQLGATVVGPHRDEIAFIINQTPAKSYGSQGQQRTLVLALKLAELKLIEEVVGEPPLLLLDDVLAELDSKRQNQLLDAIQERFQTLITATHLNSFDAQWLGNSQIFSVEAGKLAG
jgi:DNA replication and repair protein RecF